MGDPNLPAGCTSRDIDEHMGAGIELRECETCDGTGKADSIDPCDCEDCDGKGYMEIDLEQEQRELKDEADIARWEAERDDNR